MTRPHGICAADHDRVYRSVTRRLAVVGSTLLGS